MDSGKGVYTDMNNGSRLFVCDHLFESTFSMLEHRSDGCRESAAVWAGSIDENDDEWTADCVYFHHELCEDRATALSLELSETAKFHLYEELSRRRKRLVALLHTHPAEWVGLSDIDARNQISSRIGFWSIVVPWYGRRPWNVKTLGIHTRQDPGWYRVPEIDIEKRFVITNAH
jgi:proteasome lid subunit RPN8/RPN11